MLLAVWRLQEDAYSLAIRNQLVEATGFNWSLGSVYTPLERLARRGYVTSSETGATPERGGRRKRVYRLTSLGRRQLVRVHTTQEAMWQGISPASLAGGLAL